MASAVLTTANDVIVILSIAKDWDTAMQFTFQQELQVKESFQSNDRRNVRITMRHNQKTASSATADIARVA